MRCPLGHPPGPQPFCPVCGRATVPVQGETETTETVQIAEPPQPASQESVFDLDVQYDAAPPPPPPPSGPSWSDFQDDAPPAPPPPPPLPPSAPPPPGGAAGQAPASPGSAAAETQRLIEELQAGRPVVPPTFAPPSQPAPTEQTPSPAAPPVGSSSWAGGSGDAPSAPPSGSGVFPAGDMPDYAPLPPEDLGSTGDAPAAPLTPPPPPPPVSAPPPAAPPPPFDLPPRASVLDTFSDETDERSEGRDRRASKLLPLLLVLVVLLGGAFAFTQLLGGDDTEGDGVVTAPPARGGASARATAVPTYSSVQIAASLKIPHFKHGYDAGARRLKAGAVQDPRATCRALGLRERQDGYAWGAQDQQGCLVGITGQQP